MVYKKIKICLLAMCLCVLLGGFVQIKTNAKTLKLQVDIYKEQMQIVYKEDYIPYREKIVFSLPNTQNIKYTVQEENGKFRVLKYAEYGIDWEQIPKKNGTYRLLFCGRNEYTGEEKYHGFVLRTW